MKTHSFSRTTFGIVVCMVFAVGVLAAPTAAQQRMEVDGTVASEPRTGSAALALLFEAQGLDMPAGPLVLSFTPADPLYTALDLRWHATPGVETEGTPLGRFEINTVHSTPLSALLMTAALPGNLADGVAGVAAAVLAGRFVGSAGTIHTVLEMTDFITNAAAPGPGRQLAVVVCTKGNADDAGAHAATLAAARETAAQAAWTGYGGGNPPVVVHQATPSFGWLVPPPEPWRHRWLTPTPTQPVGACMKQFAVPDLGRPVDPATGEPWTGFDYTAEVEILCQACRAPGATLCSAGDPAWSVNVKDSGIRQSMIYYFEVREISRLARRYECAPDGPASDTWTMEVYWEVIMHQYVPHKVIMTLPTTNIPFRRTYVCTASVCCPPCCP